ncbi:MAG: class I SAM-dependent RNA methyltransferase, partial [Deltaproteobacteria bacterium]|nr:class I SAM-dependent RNA methyltransferase [Deltaproteobacteria bacterium]
GFANKMPVFIPMTVPGDEVEFKITRQFKNYAEGSLMKILKPSPNRVLPKCPYFGKCGGCQWQHIDYAAQILWKQLIVEEQLQRIGKIFEPNVLPTIPSPKIWNYRNRVKLHKDKNGRVGFYAAGSHEIIEIDECLISLCHPRESGDPEHLIAKEGFTQINTFQNKNLQNLVADLVKTSGANTVLELYCGNGNLTFAIAKNVRNITAADSDKRAINNACHSRKSGNPLNALDPCFRRDDTNITFICRSAQAAAKHFAKNKNVDCVVLDPPRDGCKDIIEDLLNLKPASIIYVSCNPSTLARDIAMLIKGGYFLKQAQPIDMFPQTYHIETIAFLNRGQV